jgi:hypothetical protein
MIFGNELDVVVFVIVVLTPLVLWVLGYRSRRRRNQLQQAADLIGVPHLKLGGKSLYRHDDQDFSVAAYLWGPPDESEDSIGLEISTVCTQATGFTIREAGWNHDSLRKKSHHQQATEQTRISGSHEIQSGDRRFDRRFYVEGYDVVFSRRFLSDSSRREALHSLFDLGIYQLGILDSRIFACINLKAQREFKKTYTAILDGLKKLSDLEKLPPATSKMAEFDDIPRLNVHQRSNITFLLLAILLGLGIAGYYITDNSFPPVDYPTVIVTGLLCAIPILLLTLPVLKKLIGKSSLSAYYLRIAYGGAFLILPFITCMTIAVLNGYLDESSPVNHTVRVTDKMVEKDFDGVPAYKIKLKSWTNPEKALEFAITKRLYDSIEPGQSEVTILVSAGALGFEWRTSSVKFNRSSQTLESPTINQADSIIPAANELASTLAPLQPGLNGANVISVVYGSNGVRRGSYASSGSRIWFERRNGNIVTELVETRRDEWSVYLKDENRDLRVQLDLHTRNVYFSTPMFERKVAYRILAGYLTEH